MRCAWERQEKIDAFTTQYVVGSITETVYTASLKSHLPPDEIRHLVILNQAAHRNSTPFRKGELS